MTPVSRTNAEHYVWGHACDGWFLAKTANLHVIEERLPQGSGETLHFHSKSFQFFYVLEGTAHFEMDGQHLTVDAREGLPIGPGVRHRVENRGPEDLVLLVISQPPSHGDRTDATHGPSGG